MKTNELPAGLQQMLITAQTQNWFPHFDFVLDDQNTATAFLLWLYMTNDPAFENMGEGFSLGKGVCLLGQPGVGKDAMLMLMNRWFIENRPQKKFKWTHIPEAAANIRENSSDYIRDINIYDYYFADIGKVTDETENNYGKKYIVSETIIYYRYHVFTATTSKHLTHFTSNYSIPALSKMMDARTISRLREMCNLITMTGTDRRKAAKVKNWRRDIIDPMHETPSMDEVVKSLEQNLNDGNIPITWNWSETLNYMKVKEQIVVDEQMEIEAMEKAKVEQNQLADTKTDAKFRQSMLDLLSNKQYMTFLQNKYILLGHFMNKKTV